MAESENRASEWYYGPEGKRKWIEDAESVEEFVKRAFEAGWAARNGQLDRLAVSLEGERELAGEPFRAKVPPFEVPGPPPVRRLADYAVPGPAEYPETTTMTALPVLPAGYTPTEKVPALPDDTNPGFKVPKDWPLTPLEHVQTVWDGQERSDG